MKRRLERMSDQTKEFTIKEGGILWFGSSDLSFFQLPSDDNSIEDTQFTIWNKNGNLYLVDLSNNHPTRIKADH